MWKNYNKLKNFVKVKCFNANFFYANILTSIAAGPHMVAIIFIIGTKYHGSPFRKVLLSNVIEIANSYLGNVREEDLSEWKSMVCMQ